MKKLSLTWLTDDLIDFEYKKYTLLAYLQNVQDVFNQHKLYPQLSDLIVHYDNLIKLKQNKEMLYESFPETPTGIDLNQLKITYQKLIQDDELMHQLSEIIHYALPQLDQTIDRGKEVYDFVENHLDIDEVGLMPIYQNEGYVLLTEQSDKNLSVYRYKLSLIKHHKEEFRSLHTTFISNEIKSITRTVNRIKVDLIKRFQDLPNPAIFLITSQIQFPLKETLLPIAKRLLMSRVTVQE